MKTSLRSQTRSRTGRQGGFTLIELVAVMAILGVLAAIIATNVVDTRDASIRAQAQGDAKNINTAAAKFYGGINEAEVITPHTTDVGALTGDTGTNQQSTSSRWPEKLITATTASGHASVYSVEFEPTDTPVTVVSVKLLKEDNVTAVTAADFLKMTAIDFDKIGNKLPESVERVSVVTLGTSTIEVHNFLWLFEKGSSGAGLQGDVRDVVVFQLTGTQINEGAATVNLTYKRVL